MKKKIKLLSVLTLVVSSITLSSCIFIRGDLVDSNTSSKTPTVSGDVTYNTPNYPTGSTTQLLNKDNIGLCFNQRYFPSVGTNNLLVIPVEFQKNGAVDHFSSSTLQMIENTFFGDEEDTGWESLSSFYEKSSYGKLKIQGEVATPVTSTYSLDYITEQYQKNPNYDSVYVSIVETIVKKAIEKTIANGTDISKYDNNKDGYIDGIWLIYNQHYSTTNDLFWAFTSWMTSDPSFTYNNSTYKANLYAWASISFINNGFYKNYLTSKSGDSHTIIHETGHMLGLDDYYNNTYINKVRESPTGGIDMMDYNVIDHMGYSKYFLNWITPTVINDAYVSSHGTEITINSLVDQQDCYILPVYKNNVEVNNGTPFDEYLVLETYTPTSLNQADSKHIYENGAIAPNSTGLRVYHVNAKVGKISASSNKLIWDGCSYDKIPVNNKSTYGYYYLYSNMQERSYGTIIDDVNLNYYRTRLVSILPKDEKKTTEKNLFKASSMYTKGDKFMCEGGSYTNFKFDDGNRPKYGFEVTDSTSSSVTISLKTL